MTTSTDSWLTNSTTRTDAGDAWLDAVRQLIAQRFADPSPDVRVATIARSLGISSRGLQRKLGHRGTSLSALLDEARCQVAVGLLARDNVAIVELASRLGYATGPAFFRAFRRWTGTSPRAYQKTMKTMKTTPPPAEVMESMVTAAPAGIASERTSNVA